MPKFQENIGYENCFAAGSVRGLQPFQPENHKA